MVRVSDLIPSASGRAHLGVNGGPNPGSFDITSISPFGHIHQLSGIFHDPINGQSGILRFNQQQSCFEISVDGGIVFDCLLTSLDGSGIHDINGATGPLVTLDGANGIDVFTTGNAITVDVSSLSGTIPIALSGLALSRGVDFTEQSSVTFSHGIGGQNLIVQVQDTDGEIVIPDTINVSNPNSVDVSFNRPRSGRIVTIGSSSGVSVIPAEERAGLKQGINPYSADGSGITIPVGKVHYVDNDNIHRVLKLSSEVLIDEAGGLTADDWVYVYVHASGTSDSIGSGNFDYSADIPAFDDGKLGWYDTSMGSARRCVGAIQSRNTTRWRASQSNGSLYQHSDSFTSIISNDATYVTQDVQLSLPVFSDVGILYFGGDLIGLSATVQFSWRPAGFSTGTNGLTVGRISSPAADPASVQSIAVHFHGVVNLETKKGVLEASNNNATVTALRQYGYVIPNYIGNTPG